jgi:RP/EB family microtubule-associated protein
MTESIGRMDEGYFVPRGEILRWINQVLKLDLSMIEQLGTGAVYCQLLDAVCPGLVPLHKINWKARTEYEFMENLKVLQFVFDRVGMTKKLDVRFLSTLDHETCQKQVSR